MEVSEKILHESFHTSRIELSRRALKKNIRFLKKYIGRNTIFSSVIKGNAYGHGIETFLPLAEECGVRHFSVYSPYEAYVANKVKTQESHIMIMGETTPDVIEWAIENNISFFVFSNKELNDALVAAKKLQKPAKIHLELETGLNRTGLYDKYLDQAVEKIKSNYDFIQVIGTCTHYAGAESIGNYVRIKNQTEEYNRMVATLRSMGLDTGICHTAASAAALTYPETIMNMVRFGIAHYGYWPSRETQMHYYQRNGDADNQRRKDPLRRIISWKSRIMNIKQVKPGEFVGYGTAYMTIRKQKIACVPIGYYHGFSRTLSNKGYVLVRGRRVLVVGWVNMNMMMIDVTDVPQVEVGDEVTIIGNQKKQHISVGSFSDMTSYLNYEVLVRLPEEIPRIVVD